MNSGTIISTLASEQWGFAGSRLIEMALVSALFMLVLAIVNRVLRLEVPMRRARAAMLADLYEIRLYWRRAGLILRAQAKLALHLVKYLLLLGPSVAAGAFLYFCCDDWLANRYSRQAAPAGKEVVISLSGPGITGREGLPISINSSDACITARVVVPAAHKEWIRIQPARSGILGVGLPQQQAAFWVNVARTNAPARPIERAGETEVFVDYPPYRLWGTSSGYLLYMLAAAMCLAAPASAIVRGRRVTGAIS